MFICSLATENNSDNDGPESIKSTSGLHTNFKLRVRKNQSNFQLRVRKDPNFQLRVRKSPNFQLRVRKSPNFQLRVRKSPNFQLRVRKKPNFQLMTRIVRSPSRQAFQLRVRKAISSSFQLRVRKDVSEDDSGHLDEEAYFNSLDENELDHYAQSLPEINLPGLLKLERKRKAGSFQLRV